MVSLSWWGHDRTDHAGELDRCQGNAISCHCPRPAAHGRCHHFTHRHCFDHCCNLYRPSYRRASRPPPGRLPDCLADGAGRRSVRICGTRVGRVPQSATDGADDPRGDGGRGCDGHSAHLCRWRIMEDERPRAADHVAVDSVKRRSIGTSHGADSGVRHSWWQCVDPCGCRPADAWAVCIR